RLRLSPILELQNSVLRRASPSTSARRLPLQLEQRTAPRPLAILGRCRRVKPSVQGRFYQRLRSFDRYGSHCLPFKQLLFLFSQTLQHRLDDAAAVAVAPKSCFITALAISLPYTGLNSPVTINLSLRIRARRNVSDVSAGVPAGSSFKMRCNSSSNNWLMNSGVSHRCATLVNNIHLVPLLPSLPTHTPI